MEKIGSRSSSRISKDPSSRLSQCNQEPIKTASSLSLKTVFLYKWWLVKAEQKGIAVSGFASREFGASIFISGAISKRINTTTLQTRDGMTVTISGLINRSQTLRNGFPLLVCNRFEIGFPFGWEECVGQFYKEESAKRDSTTRKDSTIENANVPLPSLDKLPATRIRELVMRLAEDSENCDDLLRKLSGDAYHSNLEKERPKVTASPDVDQILTECKRAKTDREDKGVNDGILNKKDEETEELTQSGGVAKRTRHRLKKHSSKNEENITLESSVECRNFTSKPEKSLSSNFSSGKETTAQLSTPPANKKMLKRALTDSETRSGRELPKVTASPDVDQILTECKRAKTDHEDKGINDGILNEKDEETEELTQSGGVAKRTRHRLRKHSSKNEENITLESSVECRNFTSKPEKSLSSNFSSGNETTAQLSTPPANKKMLKRALSDSETRSGRERPKVTASPDVDQILTECKRAKTDREDKGVNDGILNEKDEETEELTQSGGVAKRTRHRLKKHSSKNEENITLESSVECRNFTSKPEKSLSSNFSSGNETIAQLSTPPANKKMLKRALTDSETRSGTVRRSGRPNVRKDYTGMDRMARKKSCDHSI